MRSPLDAVRERNRQLAGPGIAEPFIDLPDEELIKTLVEHGQPRHSAEQLKHDPQLRLAAARFWTDVGDARHGDPAARERVDMLREQWARMRAAEIISDDPTRGHANTHLVDPKELL